MASFLNFCIKVLKHSLLIPEHLPKRMGQLIPELPVLSTMKWTADCKAKESIEVLSGLILVSKTYTICERKICIWPQSLAHISTGKAVRILWHYGSLRICAFWPYYLTFGQLFSVKTSWFWGNTKNCVYLSYIRRHCC